MAPCVLLADYLELLDGTGRQVHPGKRGSIRGTDPPILERLELSGDLWLLMVKKLSAKRVVQPLRKTELMAGTSVRPSTAEA